jgi:tetratricopeptide (TPR) repeat protein
VAPRSRRRRRLLWTQGVLVVAAAAGILAGVALYRGGRPATYRPGEEHAGITRQLDAGIPPEAPLPRFADVTSEAGLGAFRSFAGSRTSQLPEDMGPGAAWGDYDDDGDDDLFLVSAGGPLGAPEADLAPSLLYENLGDGTFAAVAAFPETRIHGMGAAWGDHDGDGDLDLVVSGYDALRLFRNTKGRFERDPSLPDRAGFWAGASWCDFDHDGDLDLYVCGYVQFVPAAGTSRASLQYGQAVPFTLNPASFQPERNLLFRNRGRGAFEEVARQLGVDNPQGRSLSAVWHDFDGDGWADLYVANDISDNVLYMNRGGSFQDRSHAAWVADPRGAMGLAVGDWNRDGDEDIHVTHWIAQENALYDNLWRDLEPQAQAGQPRELRFVDVADQRGVGQIALQLVGWGTEFFDFDHDGWLDLAVANGSTFETETAPKGLRPQASFLFWNRRGAAFHDLAELEPSLAAEHVSRGLAVSDYDGDGDVDLLIVDRDGGARLLRNDTARGSWIELRLRRRGGTVETAQVTLRLPDATLRRAVNSVSYLSQSSRTLHFGLAGAEQAEEVEVRWPGGGRELWRSLAANAVWELTAGAPAARKLERTESPGRVDFAGAGPERTRIARSAQDRARLAEFWRAQRAGMDAMKKDGDPRAAIEHFRAALAIDPGHEDSIYYIGNCLAEIGETEAALAAFRELTSRNPLSHRAHKRWGTLRAMTARSADDEAAAVRALERAVEINPEETGALQVLGEIALIGGQRELARERLELVVRTNAQPAQALFLLAFLSWGDGDDRRAMALLERSWRARGKDWKPTGASAEGETGKKMYTEATPLQRAVDAWDGRAAPAVAFRDLSLALRLRPPPEGEPRR